VVYVVRHAQKSRASGWDAYGALRPLSDKGARCAQALAARLAHEQVGAVYASETARTLATGVAVSAKLPATVTGDERSARDPVAFATEVIEHHTEAYAILVVGHSNTIGALIRAFQPRAAACFAAFGLRADGSLDEARYGDVWRVDLARPACDGGVRHEILGQVEGVDCMTP